MIAIYGGTFDPVHFGHLRSAIELVEALGLSELRLMPSFKPPHRDRPTTTPVQRLEMLRLAVSNTNSLRIDDREILRQGPSYTIDTLKDLRVEIGEEVGLAMVVGFDAFAKLNTWHRWEELTDVAHLVVMERPGFPALQCHQTVLDWAENKWLNRLEDLQNAACGRIYRLRLSQLEISASFIRAQIADNKNINFLLPEGVIEYIGSNRLYRPLIPV